MYNIEVPLPIPLEDIPEIWRPLYIHLWITCEQQPRARARE